MEHIARKMKKCRCCLEDKDLSLFTKNSNNIDLLSIYCKDCQSYKRYSNNYRKTAEEVFQEFYKKSSPSEMWCEVEHG